MDRFATLLADLGTLINVPLSPDSKRLCRLNIDNKLHLQIQEEENQDRLLVACFVGEIPAGKFRENLLKATLKENNAYPRLGNFAYCARNNQLALFAYVYYPGLHGDNFADFLGTFLEKAFTWKTALETGRIPERGQTIQKTGPSIFDIKRT